MKLVWSSNSITEDFKRFLFSPEDTFLKEGDLVIGEPAPSGRLSTEDLISMGVYGIYCVEEE